MSVEHLDINPEEIDKVLGPLGAKAKKDNDDDLVKSIHGIDARVDNVLYGAAAYAQQMLDEKAKLEEQKAERERQRSEIQNRHNAFKAALSGSNPEPAPPADPEPSVPSAPVVVEPEPVIPPPAIVSEPDPVVDEDEENEFISGLYTADELTEMTNEQLQLLAESYGMDIVVTDHNRLVVIARIVAAQRRWCLEYGYDDPNEPESRTQVTRIVERIDVRQWSWVQWVCAVVLGLIALVIASNTSNWPDFIDDSAPQNVFSFLWVVSLTALGFFAGGWIGSLIDDWHNRSRARRNIEE